MCLQTPLSPARVDQGVIDAVHNMGTIRHQQAEATLVGHAVGGPGSSGDCR